MRIVIATAIAVMMVLPAAAQTAGSKPTGKKMSAEACHKILKGDSRFHGGSVGGASSGQRNRAYGPAFQRCIRGQPI